MGERETTEGIESCFVGLISIVVSYATMTEDVCISGESTKDVSAVLDDETGNARLSDATK